MTDTEQLKALAEAAKGWNLNFVMNMTDEEPCEVGWKDEDGCFYPVITVDCENYFKPSGPLADYIAAANPERILALIAENERLTQPIDRETAIAHSRKDAEPVAYQYRMKPEWHDAWVKWQPCDKANFDDYVKAPVVNRWQFDARALYTHPPEADKLLQQALEALDNSVDVVREEYTEAVRRYSGLPSRKARLDSLNALLTKHESSITDIRTYLEGKK